MKNVYIWLGTGVALCIIVGMVYLVGYTRGAANEKITCSESKVAVVETVETNRKAAASLVDSASDDDVDRMLCEKYARGDCVWPNNLSDALRNIRTVSDDIGNQAPDTGK